MVNTTSISLLRRVHDATDDDAWSRFDAIYRDFICGFLTNRDVEPDVAEDVCQCVMKQVYEALTSGRFDHNGRKGAFRNWLRRVVVSQLVVFRRKSKRHERRLPPDLEEHLATDDSRLVRMWDKEHDRATLELVLSLLQNSTPPDALEIFRLTFMENASVEQVAEQFGRSKNAVVVVRCRVLKKAREVAAELLRQGATRE